MTFRLQTALRSFTKIVVLGGRGGRGGVGAIVEPAFGVICDMMSHFDVFFFTRCFTWVCGCNMVPHFALVDFCNMVSRFALVGLF